MSYVDGFVLVVKSNKIAAYKKMAADGGKVWKKFGAIDYVEAMGDDMHPKGDPGMKVLNFPKLTKAKKGEKVFFSFITYKNKAHRDSVNKKVMNYFSEKYKDQKHQDMPFDMSKMAYGGFRAIVDL